MGNPKEMSFLDHLEELRWHLIRASAAVLICMIVAFSNKHFVFHTLLLGPSRLDFWTYQKMCELGKLWGAGGALCIEALSFDIQSRLMTGQFTMHVSSSFFIGLICAFPYVFWEIWRFVTPALYSEEKRASSGATFFVSMLFCIGILFGYFLVAPLSINFLANYQVDPSIKNQFDITSYISTLTMLVLSCGLMFQIPVIILFLSKAGLVTPLLLQTFRRHAFVVILIVSAIITPPDVVSQLLVGLPIYVLYEMSIFISARVWKKKLKEEEREREKDLLEAQKSER